MTWGLADDELSSGAATLYRVAGAA
jgi:hypothetical protein